MKIDTIEYFNNQAASAILAFNARLARSHADGSFARSQWRHAANDAMRNGSVFSERTTRNIAQRWDTFPAYAVMARAISKS